MGFKGVSVCKKQGGLLSEGVEEGGAVLHFSFQIAGLFDRVYY